MIHCDKKLYLVFEFLDLDLKKHMDSHPNFGNDHQLVKVKLLADLLSIIEALCAFYCIFSCSSDNLIIFAVLLVPDAERDRILPFPQVDTPTAT